MPRRAYIIHGWDGYPGEGWQLWLRRALQERGFTAKTPAMPDTRRPVIGSWISTLQREIGAPDGETFLIGHSIGAQAICRYLETLSGGEPIGGAVFVAGWTTLTPEAFEEAGDQETARPWLETAIDWRRVKSHCSKFTAIFSDSDPFVPLSDADVFHKNLGAEIIIESGKGHFSGSDGITELTSALATVLNYAKAG